VVAMGVDAEAGTFLELLEATDRQQLDGLGRVCHFPDHTRLMHEGEPGDRVMILHNGHVKASYVTDQGHEIVLGFRGPGDLLGELSFMDERQRASSVTAIEPVEALVFSASSFRSYLQATPGAALTMLAVISDRFRDADRKRIQFGASDTTGRVAARLVELVERYGEASDRGTEIALPITQEELGGWVASSRAGVADALRTLRELGWIETDRRRITVCDVDALRARSA